VQLHAAGASLPSELHDGLPVITNGLLHDVVMHPPGPLTEAPGRENPASLYTSQMSAQNAAAIGAGQIVPRGIKLKKVRPPHIEKGSKEWLRRRDMYLRVRKEELALKRIWKKSGLSRAAAHWRVQRKRAGKLPPTPPGSMEWRRRRKAQIIQMRHEQLLERAKMLKSGYLHETGTTAIMRLRAEVAGESARRGDWQALGDSVEKAVGRRLQVDIEGKLSWAGESDEAVGCAELTVTRQLQAKSDSKKGLLGSWQSPGGCPGAALREESLAEYTSVGHVGDSIHVLPRRLTESVGEFVRLGALAAIRCQPHTEGTGKSAKLTESAKTAVKSQLHSLAPGHGNRTEVAPGLRRLFHLQPLSHHSRFAFVLLFHPQRAPHCNACVR
jgi:hypothetical protein